MKLYDVYPLFDINIVKGKGCHVWDEKGNEYLDLYGGHAVISIGTSALLLGNSRIKEPHGLVYGVAKSRTQLSD